MSWFRLVSHLKSNKQDGEDCKLLTKVARLALAPAQQVNELLLPLLRPLLLSQ
jgi:hypothetical protein